MAIFVLYGKNNSGDVAWDIGADAYIAASLACAVTGTIVSSATEVDIRTGGKTFILTLTGTTWVPA
jgi:hypothetical protein